MNTNQKRNGKYKILILHRHRPYCLFYLCLSSEKLPKYASILALIILYIPRERDIYSIFLSDWHLNQMVSFLREKESCPIFTFVSVASSLVLDTK